MKRMIAVLTAVATLMLAGTPAQAAESAVHAGQGTVNRVDANAGKVNLTHGPISSLKWPGMTMDFAVKDQKLLAGIKPGQKVEFKLSEQSKGQYVITDIVQAK